MQAVTRCSDNFPRVGRCHCRCEIGKRLEGFWPFKLNEGTELTPTGVAPLRVRRCARLGAAVELERLLLARREMRSATGDRECAHGQVRVRRRGDLREHLRFGMAAVA